MGEIASRRLGLAATTVLLFSMTLVPSAAGQGQGLQLPDVTQAPLVDDVVDTVESTTGVDLPVGQQEQPPAAPPPSSPPPSPTGDTGSSAPSSSAPAAGPSPSTATSTPTSPAAPASTPAAGSGQPGPQPAGGNPKGVGGTVRTPDRSRSNQQDRDSSAARANAEEPPPQRSAIGRLVSGIEELPWGLLLAVVALAAIGVFMAVRSGMLAGRGRRLAAQRSELREDVGAMQAALLPEVPDRIGDVGLSVAYRPSDGPAAGGDFHDVVELNGGRIALLIGDVSGHGRQALTVTALAHYTVRAYLEAGLEPRQALRLTETAVGDKLGENFVTVMAAVYDPADSTFTFATAGHPPPVVVGQSRVDDVELLAPPPIGIGPQTGYRQTTVSVPRGAAIWVFTDGITEARLGEGELLEREGVIAILDELTADDGADELLEIVGGQTRVADDATVCMVRPLDAGGDGTVVEEIDVALLGGLADRVGAFLEACGLAPVEARRALAALHRRDGAQPGARLRVIRSREVRWEVLEPKPSEVDPLAATDGRTRSRRGQQTAARSHA